MTVQRQKGSTLDQLFVLAAGRFGKQVQDLHAEADLFAALGIDSVQVLELLSELESAFDVEIPDYALRDVKTFGGLAAEIDRRR